MIVLDRVSATLYVQGMNTESLRHLKAFDEISGNPDLTQRHLAQKLEVALGLANLMIRRLVKKGHLKVVSVQPNRIRYLLTPQGMMEKARLTREYMEYSLYVYQALRKTLRENLSRVVAGGAKEVVFFGTGEVAEICYLTLKELDLNLVGIIDEAQAGGNFLGVPIYRVEDLAKLRFDCGIINAIQDGNGWTQQLSSLKIPQHKIMVLQHHEKEVNTAFAPVGSRQTLKGGDRGIRR